MTQPQPAEWTEAEVKTLRKLAAEGRSGREIAAILGKSRSAISGQAGRRKIRLMGINKINPRPVAWTPERIAEFKRRWVGSESIDALAASYLMTVNSVRARAWKFGLQPRGRKPEPEKRPVRAPQEATSQPVRPVTLPTTPPDVPGPHSGPSWTLTGRYCHWPHGHAARGHMDEIIKCGTPIKDGVYCDDHWAIAIRPDTHPRSQARADKKIP